MSDFLIKYMSGFLGLDSSLLEIAYPSGTSFKTMLGVGILVDDYERFSTEYSNALNYVFEKIGTPREKKVYSNYDFIKLFNITHQPVHSIFFEKIKPTIKELFVCFTSINKAERMNIYGKLSREKKIRLLKSSVDGFKILDQISSYFPILTLWKFHSRLGYIKPQIFLDGIEVPDFDGLRDINDLDYKIVFNGDRCNPLVATADLMIKLIEIKMKQKRLRYELLNINNMIKNEFKGKVNILKNSTDFVGS